MTSPSAPLALASSSPRRREIMESAGLRFQVIHPRVFEGPPLDGESPPAYVKRLALEKAAAVSARLRGCVVVGADTIVALDGETLGKPASRGQAEGMLRRLRGRVHQVTTGVAAVADGRDHALAVTSNVHMRRYSDHEIAAYAASGEPYDKAGGYAVQDARFRPADRVEGCYLNVVGLPLCELSALLSRFGITTEPRPGWRPPAQCVECPLDGAGEAERA